jgi:hypothetical protein
MFIQMFFIGMNYLLILRHRQRTQARPSVHTYTHAYADNARTQAGIHAYTILHLLYGPLLVYVHIYIYIYIYMQIDTDICRYMQIYTDICRYMQIYTYMYIYTQILFKPSDFLIICSERCKLFSSINCNVL